MRTVSACIVLFLWAALALTAQVSSGTINVIAEDSTQAIIPNATVIVTNKNTGLTRTGQTGPQGEFQATFLPAGEYSISVQMQSFKRSTINLFTLQVDQSTTVRVTLTPGDVVETVQVARFPYRKSTQRRFQSLN